MQKFEKVTAIAAGIPIANIDTDQILAGRFLKTVKREGLGNALFHSLRFDETGHERPGFVLNQHPWRSAGILVALDNFGCGSSREHAPWALADFGIRVILAPSFADIFRNNCFKNGILTVELDRARITRIIAEIARPEAARLTIDLSAQVVETARGEQFPFDIPAEKKELLQLGLDEIDLTDGEGERIAAFETAKRYPCPPIQLHEQARP